MAARCCATSLIHPASNHRRNTRSLRLHAGRARVLAHSSFRFSSWSDQLAGGRSLARSATTTMAALRAGPAGADRLSSAWLRCPLPPKSSYTADPAPSLTPRSTRHPGWQSLAPPVGQISHRRWPHSMSLLRWPFLANFDRVWVQHHLSSTFTTPSLPNCWRGEQAKRKWEDRATFLTKLSMRSREWHPSIRGGSALRRVMA